MTCRLVNVESGDWREYDDVDRARDVMRDLERIDADVSLRIEQEPFSATSEKPDPSPTEGQTRSLGVLDGRYTGITPDTAEDAV